MDDNTQRGSRGALAAAAGVGSLFVVAGVVMLLVGDDRVLIGGLALSGIGVMAAVVAVSTLLSRRDAAPAEPPPVDLEHTVRYERTGTAIADLAIGIAAGVFLGSFILAGLVSGVFAFTVVATAMFLFLVPISIVSGVRRLRDPIALELTPSALRTPDVGRIPWTDIERLEIQDLYPVHARRGTVVVGDTRQLAIHLLPGVEPPELTFVDSIVRAGMRGILWLGRDRARGAYHWLAIPERTLPVSLEEVLAVATEYHAAASARVRAAHAKIDGPAPTPRPSAHQPAQASGALPTGPAAKPAGPLAAEAAALTAARADAKPQPSPTAVPERPLARVLVVLALGGVAVGAAVLLGAAMTSAMTGTIEGPPWPLVALGLLLAAIRFGAYVARGAWSWLRRPLSLAVVPTAIVAFVAGAIGTGMLMSAGMLPTGVAPTAPVPVADVPVAPVTLRASSDLPEGTVDLATDGRLDTVWNSGAHPPGWIEIDLGMERSVRRIRLLTEQMPAGRTIHRIHVAGDAGGAYRFVREFDGVTDAGRWLEFAPPEPLQGVRSIVVETVESPSWVAWREIVVESD